MASFAFNFQIEEDSDVVSTENATTDQKSEKNLVLAKEIPFHTPQGLCGVIESIKILNGFAVIQKFKKSVKDLAKESDESKKIAEILQKGDLLSGVYEGGFKLWECAVDLVEFLAETIVKPSGNRHTFQNKSVLELGCGHALPGIYCLQLGANAHLADYNEEVIEQLTLPNIRINMESEPIDEWSKRVKCFSGDWGSLDTLMSPSENWKYDYILTSDTLYNIEYYPALYQMIKNHLKKDGVAFVAAKTYYFGVGGGTRQFEKVVKQDGVLDVTTVKDFEDGSSNVREILKLTFK